MTTTVLECAPRNDAEYRIAISQMLADLKQMTAEMNEAQREIDRRHIDIQEQLRRIKERF